MQFTSPKFLKRLLIRILLLAAFLFIGLPFLNLFASNRKSPGAHTDSIEETSHYDRKHRSTNFSATPAHSQIGGKKIQSEDEKIEKLEGQNEFVQRHPKKSKRSKYEKSSLAIEGIPKYVLEAIPSKIQHLFPYKAVYDFDIENKAHTDQQQAERRIKRLRDFCASPISKKTGIRKVSPTKGITLYEGYNTLECGMAKTGESMFKAYYQQLTIVKNRLLCRKIVPNHKQD